MIVLVDADILVYGAAFMAEQAHDFGDGKHAVTADEDRAHAEVETMLDVIADKTGAERAVLCLTDNSEDNFRAKFFPDYKDGRRDAYQGKRRPLLYKPLRAWMREKYETIQRPGLEADDILGILATSDTPKFRGPKIIASIDKDLLTVPGLHYNWRRPELGVVTVGPDEADHYHMVQTLVGDRTDNYPGLKGVGPVRAERILADAAQIPRHEWPLVRKAYEAKGQTEPPLDALTQARCARILRAEDYNFKTQEVILWTP